MSVQANLEGIGVPIEATPQLQVPERRTVRESAREGHGIDRWLAVGILGGSTLIYGLLGVLVYLAAS